MYATKPLIFIMCYHTSNTVICNTKLYNLRALHPSKLDIGYCQKVGDIVNLKSGYWILPTENEILGYWVHWNLDIGTLFSPQLSAFGAAGAAGRGY